jgi:WD40 repeat protein
MLTLQGHRGKVRGLAFSPDNRRLATIAGKERRISLWELPGGGRTLLPGKPTEVQALTWSPDGRSVVFASDRYLCRWDVGEGTVAEKWLRAANYCRQVAFAPDGALLAASCFHRYGAADCYRVDLFRTAALPEKTWLVGDYGFPVCLAFSPDGRFLAAGGDCKTVRVWSMVEKARTVTWKCGAAVHSVAFSPDGKVAAVVVGRALKLYSTDTHKPCGELTGHAGVVRALSFSPDGTLLSAGDDGTARLWDVAAGRERAAFDWQVGPVGVAAFSPDGMLAAVGGKGGLVVWNVD